MVINSFCRLITSHYCPCLMRTSQSLSRLWIEFRDGLLHCHRMNIWLNGGTWHHMLMPTHLADCHCQSYLLHQQPQQKLFYWLRIFNILVRTSKFHWFPVTPTYLHLGTVFSSVNVDICWAHTAVGSDLFCCSPYCQWKGGVAEWWFHLKEGREC